MKEIASEEEHRVLSLEEKSAEAEVSPLSVRSVGHLIVGVGHTTPSAGPGGI